MGIEVHVGYVKECQTHREHTQWLARSKRQPQTTICWAACREGIHPVVDPGLWLSSVFGG